jgi:hypothetical protein
MAIVGGDTLEITYNHPTIGSGALKVKADEDATMQRGGFRTADDEALITADGEMIVTKTRKPWKYTSGPIAWNITEKDEQDKLAKLAESSVAAVWTIQHISGAIFKGTGYPVGEQEGSLKGATVGLVLQGGGKLEKIS